MHIGDPVQSAGPSGGDVTVTVVRSGQIEAEFDRPLISIIHNINGY